MISGGKNMDRIDVIIAREDGWMIVWESGTITDELSKRELIANIEGDR
jgi:hypothetical protein